MRALKGQEAEAHKLQGLHACMCHSPSASLLATEWLDSLVSSLLGVLRMLLPDLSRLPWVEIWPEYLRLTPDPDPCSSSEFGAEVEGRPPGGVLELLPASRHLMRSHCRCCRKHSTGRMGGSSTLGTGWRCCVLELCEEHCAVAGHGAKRTAVPRMQTHKPLLLCCVHGQERRWATYQQRIHPFFFTGKLLGGAVETVEGGLGAGGSGVGGQVNWAEWPWQRGSILKPMCGGTSGPADGDVGAASSPDPKAKENPIDATAHP